MTYINPRSKILHHPDHLVQLKTTGKTLAPINVEIDLSNRCSLGCTWCHFAYTHTRGPLAGKAEKPAGHIDGGDLMDLALGERILEQLAEAGVKSVTWAGGGEPTLHPQFEDIVRHAATVGLQQGIYTHGGHIDAASAGLLRRLFTWVYVSLDECDADSYRASKGVNGFGRATDGIRHLVSALGAATIGVGFLLHQGNYRRTREMVALGQSLGVDYVQFRPTIHYSHDAPGELAENTRWMHQACARLRAHEGDSFVIVDLARFSEYRDWQGHGYATCNWSAMQTVITPNGKVWRCVNKREQPGALLGDLSNEPFISVWQRAGGPCAVDGTCRVMCRGHSANLTLDAVLAETTHGAFV
jgi:MoaA/NifB/PqqE/SkfB family radical SAM enzyme